MHNPTERIHGERDTKYGADEPMTVPIHLLLAIMHEVRRLVALPDNNFMWSSWEDAPSALFELDEAIALVSRGEVPVSTLRVFFAPTGPLQEVSISSGWGDEFIALADRFDHAVSSAPRTSSLRVVSLLPSATELVVWLGAFDSLRGISHECDFPESVKTLPVLTRSRIDLHASSRTIDTAVRSVIDNALSIYAIDENKLAALAPDVVITQDLCEVCAVSLDDVKSAVARLAYKESGRVAIVSLRPTRLEHVFDDIERVAKALDVSADGRMLRVYLEARIRAVSDRVRAHAITRPRVVSIEWIDPLMLGGLWMPELIELAGGIAAGAKTGEPAPTITREQLAALEPEVVLIKPCGFKLDRTLEERAAIEDNIARVVPNARIYVADGNAYFNRPGPRLVESVEILAACTHPAIFEDLATKHRDGFRTL